MPEPRPVAEHSLPSRNIPRPITVRFFAAAKAAFGAGEWAVDAVGFQRGPYEAPRPVASAALDVPGVPISALLAAAVDAAHGGTRADAARVFARCSFLIDGVATRDAAAVVPAGATLDVLPPFAGG